jgi:16S rRNA (guanine966-N2)-methyltransferase
MRVTGGKARSVSLHCPKGDWVRPATDRMREAVFASLGRDVVGARFLDLYAGAGTYGMEAISRGASGGAFVERNRAGVASIRQNLAAVIKSAGLSATQAANFEVKEAEVKPLLERMHSAGWLGTCDLVFIDPPYEDVAGSYFGVLEALVPLLHLEKGAWILLESPGLLERFPGGYVLRKTFGKGREDTRAMLLSWLPGRT